MTASSPAAAVSGRLAAQPGLGAAGLLFVVPPAALLAAGAGGPETSLLVLGPLVTFALPVIAMIAFWWEGWPGARLHPGWSGLANTVLIVVAAPLLTVLGQAVLGDVDVRAIFDPTPGAGHAPTFPQTLPLGGTAFVAMLQLTLVCEGWPLRGMGRLSGGAVALATAWACALLVQFAVVEPELLTGAEVGAVLVLIGAWQVCFYVGWQGWPFSTIERRPRRLAVANAAVVAGGIATFAAGTALGVSAPTATAAAGSYIAAALVIGMLFEDWLPRAKTLAASFALAAALFGLLSLYADSLDWTRASAEEWVGHVGLNAIGVAVILHVAIGRRWPFGS